MPTTPNQNARKARHAEYMGRQIVVSGDCWNCLVWIDNRMAFGPDRRFKSIKKAMERAQAFIRRQEEVRAETKARIAHSLTA